MQESALTPIMDEAAICDLIMRSAADPGVGRRVAEGEKFQSRKRGKPMRFLPGQVVTVVDNFNVPWPKIGDSFRVSSVEDVPLQHAQDFPSWPGKDEGKPCPTPRDMVGHEQWVIIELPDGGEKRMSGRFFDPSPKP